MTTTIDRERRVELLAALDRDPLVALADRCLGRVDPVIVQEPEVGMVMLPVREPVAHERFYLGEVLVTRAEVEIDGHRGWSMRMGDDRAATLAAAICDAVVESGGPEAADVVELCRWSAESAAAAERAEWAELSETEVTFEELD
ncbi:MAG: phosphonate C-P lyase system protein PhnG [Actinomycetota bacterium]